MRQPAPPPETGRPGFCAATGAFRPFYMVRMQKTSCFRSTITGKGPGRRKLGGILQFVFRELEVLCLPNEIPDAIRIDVTELG
jgi:hypothetical protein